MNIYGVLVLAGLLGRFLIGLTTSLLNLGTLSAPLPAEFEGVYTVEAYRRSQSYLKVRTRFELIDSSFDLLAMLLFWFLGGFNRLDVLVRGWGFGPILTGSFYLGLLILLGLLFMLPFSLYSTFVIEARFGFNKTSPRTYALDILKALPLAVVLGGPLLMGILALFERGGTKAWLYAWGLVVASVIIAQFVFPKWIMPLFNKFTPLAEGELRDRVIDIARSAGFPISGVYIMDGSKRTGKANAFITGFGRARRIALYDTLIDKHTVAELIAILAHEIGHFKKKHALKMAWLTVLETGVVFYLLSLFLKRPGLHEAFYMSHISVYAGMLFFAFFMGLFEIPASAVLNALLRRNELAADRYACKMTGSPEDLSNAIKKLSLDHLAHLTPHPFEVAIHHSHPPPLQRIRAIDALTKKGKWSRHDDAPEAAVRRSAP
jgi:STE24 endopeptidase